MTTIRLILRTLRHYRAINFALVLGIALATAVLTGSLLVGDSIRASLRDLALARLGPVTYVLGSPRPFPESLAVRLQTNTPDSTDVRFYPALMMRGRASTEHAAAVHVQILGVGEYKPKQAKIDALSNSLAAAEIRGDQGIINGELADHLENTEHGGMLLSIPQIDALPRDAILAQRARTSVLGTLRVNSVAVTRETNMLSLFDLSPSQRTPRNAWVNLADLQRSLDQPGQVNTLLVTGDADVQQLNAALKKVLTLGDLGLALKAPAGSPRAIVDSNSIYFLPALEAAADKTGVPLQKINTNLLNSVSVSGDATQPTATGSNSATLHYVVASGITSLDDGTSLAPEEVAINQWTAEQLHAKVGDSLTFTLWHRKPNGTLGTISSTDVGLHFKIVRILPMSGLGADGSLTPTYKGLTDADSIHDWNPPEGVDINKTLVTADDEAYWRDYRAAPKIFLNFETAGKLFSSPFGRLTQIRLPAAQVDGFTKSLLAGIDPASLGLSFQSIRAQQLAGASGSTDFSGLFIGFSFFLILSALILLALLFRLSVEQRLPQLGLLASVGFTPKRLRNLLMVEGLFLALLGTILGTAGALAYTALMIKLLTTLWFPAVGTTNLHLSAAPESLITGAVISLVLAAVTLLLAIRRYAKENPIVLLTNRPAESVESRESKSSRLWSWVPGSRAWAFFFVLVAAASVIAGSTHAIPLEIACMLAGLFILIASLLLAHRYLQKPLKFGTWSLNLRRLAMRNARIRPTRSLLVIALIACASFILILVGSMKQGTPDNPDKTPSGTGGYRLILTADIPLLGDLGTHEGRKLLAIKDTDNPLFGRAKFTSLHAWQGQDISCLNMTRPTQPTIVEAPGSLSRRFIIADQTLDNAITTSTVRPRGQSPIPVTADSNTSQYILQLPLGGSMSITDQMSTSRELVLDETLDGSIFQSELLMNSADFQAIFPLQTGFSIVLVECTAEDAASLTHLLESELDDFSVTVEPTAARLARYKDVENTYLATFQTLGGLGLLLGTVGLAIILLRSTLERRPELALLLALGFTRGRIAGLILLENVLLLAAGLGIGTLTALLAVAPAARALNLPALVVSFILIFVTGLAALMIALRLASRHLTAAAIRGD